MDVLAKRHRRCIHAHCECRHLAAVVGVASTIHLISIFFVITKVGKVGALSIAIHLSG